MPTCVSLLVVVACDPVLDVGTFIGAASSPTTAPPPSDTTERPPSAPSGTTDSGTAPGPRPILDSGAAPSPTSAAVDSGVFDSGALDSGAIDAGRVDSGLRDAGRIPDAGRSDSGADAAAICTSAPLPPPSPSGGAPSPATAPLTLPWATDFENGFCDYLNVNGYCYSSPLAEYELVESPVRSGRYAAAFRVTPTDTEEQSRCVRRGELPRAAYYGAWYYLPEQAETTGNWNLFHFRGGASAATVGIWDVSVGTDAAGQLSLYVRDPTGTIVPPEAPPPVPIGAWFHVEFLLRRAADATGEVALYQDGELLVQLTNVVTYDGAFGEWYVGSLSNGVIPSDYTLYVDDVSIRAAE